MRILFVSPLTPYLPCHDSARSAPAQLIAHLAREHEIALVTTESPGETKTQRDWAAQHCVSVDRIAAQRWRNPLTGAPERGLTALRAAIERASARFKPAVLHLGGPMLAPLAKTANLPTVLDASDSRALRAREARHLAKGLGAWLKATIDARLESAWERRWFPTVDVAVVPSEEDRREVARHVPFSRVEVIPCGIDVEHYAFRRAGESDRLVFVGNLAWRPNADAVHRLATRVMPAVRKLRPRAELIVLGADPLGVARMLGKRPGVRVVGTVSDVRSTIWSAAVAVSALAAGVGVKNRILETMALGTPVVGAADSLAGLPDILAGHHALVADNDDAVLDAVLMPLREPVVAQTLARNARALIEQRYTWTAVARHYGALYARAAKIDAPTAVAA